MNIKHYIDREVRRQVRSSMVAKKYRDDDVALAKEGSEMTQKAVSKLERFKQKYPTLSKIIRIFLKIDGTFQAVRAGSQGAMAATTVIYRLIKEGKAQLKVESKMLPSPIVMFIQSALNGLVAFLKFKLAKKFDHAIRRRKSGRHSDAQLIRYVRRINDGALESLVQKLKAATEKAIEWCKQKKEEYPNAAKLLILLLKINGWCGLVMQGGSAAILGVGAIAAPKEFMIGVKHYINEFGPIKYVLAVIIALLKNISSLIAAKKLEEL